MTKKFGEEFPKIGAPAFRALDTVGVRHIQDLTKFSKKELLSLHGFGPKALKLVIAELKVNGLSLVTK